MPNTLLRDKFLTHLRRVETLADAGIPPPKAWQLLCDRHTKFRYMELPACDQLVAAILNPSKGADVVLLHSLALAEQANPMQQATVDNAVARAVEARLLDLYAPAAQANYAAAAARFDTAAQALTDAAGVIDPETPATDVVGADDEARTAWSAAEAAAAQLDAALPILTVAAELAGCSVDAEDGTLLTLCVDPTDMGRRQLWEAWIHKTGRCHRWAALTKLGARIRAAAELADITPYRQPRELEVRQVPAPGAPRGFYETVVVDPEEPGYRPQQPDMGLIPGRMLTQ